MKKTIFLLSLIAISILAIMTDISVIHNKILVGKQGPLYPFSVTLEDKSTQEVQVYNGTWQQTGGNVVDYHKILQSDVNGKQTTLPLISQKKTNQGTVVFMLPPGKYFVYIPNIIYEDDLPHTITIPQDTSLFISANRH
jgi:hypothetical protein